LQQEKDDFSPGEHVFKHLLLSKETVVGYEMARKNWKGLIKNTGMSSEKAFLQAVKKVSVSTENDYIQFEPFKLKIAQKMFYRLADKIVAVKSDVDPIKVALVLKESWENCYTFSQ
jgi:hypothetical protein